MQIIIPLIMKDYSVCHTGAGFSIAAFRDYEQDCIIHSVDFRPKKLKSSVWTHLPANSSVVTTADPYGKAFGRCMGKNET